jgi:ribosomal protein L7/L12
MTLTPAETFGISALWVLAVLLLAILGARIKGLQSRMGVMSRLEAKVDLLLKQANITFDPYANVPPEIAQAVRDGKKIEAIKLYRQSSGLGLKEAKEYIEGVERRAGVG